MGASSGFEHDRRLLFLWHDFRSCSLASLLLTGLTESLNATGLGHATLACQNVRVAWSCRGTLHVRLLWLVSHELIVRIEAALGFLVLRSLQGLLVLFVRITVFLLVRAEGLIENEGMLEDAVSSVEKLTVA